MNSKVTSSLSSLPPFASLSPETLAEIVKIARKRDYRPGAIIQHEGDPCEYAGFVLSGAVRIYRSNPDGREQVLSTAGPGMHFNTVPILEGDGPLRASVQALTDCSLLLIPAGPYRELLQTRADLAYSILVDFAGRLDHLTRLASDLTLKSVRARLARFLLTQAEANAVGERWTQDEIAAALGTVRDVVGRTLRGFTEAGLVRREGGRLVIVDKEGLEAVEKDA
jgi:CRP/FNR family transcriptional regulator